MAAQSKMVINGFSWAFNKIGSVLGFTGRNKALTAGGLAVGDWNLNNAEGLKSVFSAAVKMGAKTLGIDPDSINSKYALPIVATAGAGLLGVLIGGQNFGMLATAVTGITMAYKYLTGGSEVAPAQVVNKGAPANSRI